MVRNLFLSMSNKQRNIFLKTRISCCETIKMTMSNNCSVQKIAETPLVAASEAEHINVVSCLIKNGAEIDSESGKKVRFFAMNLEKFDAIRKTSKLKISFGEQLVFKTEI